MSKKSRTVTVTFKKATGASGYEVLYSMSKNGTYKTINTKGKTTVTISKLSRKKVVYVKVRAYKVINGKKVYGTPGTVKTVKVK